MSRETSSLLHLLGIDASKEVGDFYNPTTISKMNHHLRSLPTNDPERRKAASSLRQWILSLSWSELSEAAAIPLTADDEVLLRRMVSARVPPETAIHPRACPSKAYIFDGRSPAVQKHHRRTHAPRLLTLVNEASFLSSAISNNVPLTSSTNRKRRSRNAQQQQQQQQQQLHLEASSYSVTGRSFISRFGGDRWSIPPTTELQQADQDILERARIVPVDGCNESVNSINSHNSNNNGPLRSVLVWDISDLGNENNDREPNRNQRSGHRLVQDMYRLWFLASRGNLGASSGKGTKLGTADWLDPTDSWFTLGMYLVSRVELLLYQRFHNECTSSLLPCPLEEIITRDFSTSTWYGAIRSIFKSDIDGIVAKSNHPRRSSIWEVMDEWIVSQSRISDRKLHHGKHNDNKNNEIFDSNCSLPLLSFDSVSGRIWEKMRDLFREEEARRIEEELLCDIQDEETVKTATKKNTSSIQTTSKSAKKRKKKKKENSNSQNSQPSQYSGHNPERKLSGIDPAKDSVDADDIDTKLMGVVSGLSFPRVEDKGMTREQNRNMVLVLSIIDDLMDNVYAQVGLATKREEIESVDLVPVGTRPPNVVKQTRFLKPKSMIPVPSRSRPPTKQSVVSMKSTQLPSTKSVKATNPVRTRVMPSKLAPISSCIDETEAIEATTDDKSEASTWPFYQADFLPPQAATFENGGEANSNTGGGTFGGLTTPDTIYNAFVGSPWLKQGPSDIPLWEPDNCIAFGQWRTLQGLGGRDRSIMEEFFRTQRERELARDENQMASSTIASIASSAEDVDVTVEEAMDGLDEPSLEDETINEEDEFPPESSEETRMPPKILIVDTSSHSEDQLEINPGRSSDIFTSESSKFASRSASPKAPPTPLLVSLGDLRGLREDIIVVEQQEQDRDSSSNQHSAPSVRSVPIVLAGSLSGSPKNHPPHVSSNLSEESLQVSLSGDGEVSNVRAPKRSPSTFSDVDVAPAQQESKKVVTMKSRDDTEIRPRGYVRKAVDALDSYRNAAARSLKSRDDHDLRHSRTTPPRNPSHRGAAASFGAFQRLSNEQTRVFGALPFDPTESNGDRCARSEVGQEDAARFQENRRNTPTDDADNNTVTRDGSTTITSALSQRETEESLREERDTYRDLCLTLGAEVASLKNLLAQFRGAASYPTFEHTGNFPNSNGAYQFFDPDSVSHIVQRYSRQQTMAAMSDAGYRGEHESMASEDEMTRDRPTAAQRAQVSANATVGGSDISVEQSVRHETIPVAVPTLRHSYYQLPMGGFQSRLGRDILQFVDSINMQLQKQDSRRAKAVERMTRLVKTVWPRAQVKVYGSHVTGLCLPGSDVDFVICLPAVHKNAPAVAPGALEGRNAINETSQKLLARKLKSESWIDTRSMQLIDRTVVPVIKVSTKDTRARSIHLDITFDSPNHHGVEAVDMVLDIMQELPMIRPLMLVLKRFLDGKNLLSAYKGGLSSYCLFLMTARYLQEQSSSWGDCGSLLMGFLDFYGNHFNARLTGISVRNRLYFARPSYGPAMQAQPIWQPQVMAPQHVSNHHSGGHDKSLARRNSFNDKGGIDGVRGTTTTIDRNERYPTVGFNAPPVTEMDPNQFNHGMPCTFTFDPLFVEDPLSPGNNVGRNAFRFPQIQRSFSDAHRALLAALEWDLESSEDLHDGAEYPLLKSLLRSEDVVCDL